MLKKALTSTVEPIAYAILFLLTIRRIIGGGLISLEDLTFEKTIHEMVLWVLLTLLFLWIAYSKSIIRKMISAWGKNWFFLLFILFALCSIAWSSNIDASIYKGISLVGCSAIAAYTGLAYSNKILFRGFWWFFIFVTIATFAVALLFPMVGTHIGYPYYGAGGVYSGLKTIWVRSWRLETWFSFSILPQQGKSFCLCSGISYSIS
jgi:hypothetical protein